MTVPRPHLALVVLASMLFCFLTSEVFTAGALVPMSRDLGVPSSRTGMLVTAYAVVAAVAIIPMTRLTRAWSPRGLLAAAMVVLAASHVVMGAGPSFGWVLGSRAVAAVFHGVVWSSAPVVAARLMPERPAAATGAVFVGSSIANVLGAPLVAAVSEQWTWRWASSALAVASLACAVLLAVVLPGGRSGSPADGPERGDAASRRAVALWSGLVILLAAAHLVAFTFVTEDALAAGVGTAGLPVLLLAMGVAGLVGTWLMGRVHDRVPHAATVAAMLTMAVGLALTIAPRGVFVAGAALWSLAYAALTVALQAFIIRDAPTWSRTASAWYVLAFQIGIGAGAALGGVHLGPLPQHVTRPLVGSVFAVVATGLLIVHLVTSTRRYGGGMSRTTSQPPTARG